MSEEKIDDPSGEEEVEEKDEENYDDLDDILNDDDEKKEEKKESSEEDKNKNEKKEEKKEEKTFNKKVGNREFTSSEDYDAFVLKINGVNSNLAGEVKRLGGDPKTAAQGKADAIEEKETDKKAPTEKKELTDEQQYYKIEKVRFEKQFSEAKDHKEEMALFLRKGKANINGEPSFAVALAKSLRADGKPIPERLMQRIASEKGVDTSKTATKKVIKSGGRNNAGQDSGQHTYDEESKQELSDFGDKVALGRI